MSVLVTARFHTTVAQARQLPPDGIPEVAFIGRSNAGKSSAINVLCQRRRLAFASRTPGRTQALNFFAVGRGDEITGFIVDTPGYGYAAAPGAVRGAWDALAGTYLQARSALQGAVLMLDIRREVTDLDRHMLAWLPPALPLVVLLTKCDKLAASRQTIVRRQVLAQLAELGRGDQARVLLFSATTRKGIDEARAAVGRLLGEAPDEPKKTPTKG
ncbi:MAG: ribosome biogenesis GTP-binding protein YihA/YsxC [Burkholderiaceae bacterium]